MASIRRTLSPAYHDRSYQNGAIPIAGTSPKYTRKGQHSQPSWKRFVLQFSLFLAIGFVFGMVPFRSSVDDRNHDLKSPPVIVKFNRRFNLEHREFVLDTRRLGVEKLLNVKGKVMVIPKKQVIVVTPTYNRAFQAYFLSRLAQTLRLVPPPLLWIVVEMNAPSMETAEILRNSGVMYRHLVFTKNLTNIKDRGVHQRNLALEHIEHHRLDGIVYFADDDNVYSLELFESLRQISRFGTWPVAMLALNKNKAILEGPVCNGSQVIGWHTNEKSKRLRRFHVDMSGFAFNSTILWDPRRWRRPTLTPIRQFDTVKEGFQETTFIEQVVEDENQMEAIPPGCLSILNWHLHLEARDLFYPRGWLLKKDLDVVLPFFMMGTHTILHAQSHMPVDDALASKALVASSIEAI